MTVFSNMSTSILLLWGNLDAFLPEGWSRFKSTRGTCEEFNWLRRSGQWSRLAEEAETVGEFPTLPEILARAYHKS
jgi:hypothetical protein